MIDEAMLDALIREVFTLPAPVPFEIPRMPSWATARRDIDKNRLMSLAEVANASGLPLSALRTEAHKGNLIVSRIAGKDFTTLADIERMAQTCRVATKAPASGSDRPAAEEPRLPSSSSSTVEDKLALDAALMRAKKLKSGSPITSPTNTRRNVVSVHFPKSGSRT
jgi:hypothetical protein